MCHNAGKRYKDIGIFFINKSFLMDKGRIITFTAIPVLRGLINTEVGSSKSRADLTKNGKVSTCLGRYRTNLMFLECAI